MNTVLKKRSLFIPVIVALILGILYADYLGLFNALDASAYDTCFRLRGNRPVSPRIIIVAIDEKTLRRYGNWPLRRRYYAELLDRLNQAAVVGFDLLLQDHSEDDAVLSLAISRNGRVVLPEYIDGGMHVIKPRHVGIQARSGHIHIELGIDNVAREVYHTLSCRTVTLPSLTSVMCETAGFHPFERRRGNNPHTALASPQRIIQSDLQKINFYGAPGHFPRISMADILTDRVPSVFFRDKFVLVGLAVPGIVDEIATPFSQARNRMAGVEAHANILNNLLDGNAIREVPETVHILGILVAALAMTFLFLRLAEQYAIVAMFICVAIAVPLTVALLFHYNYWLPPTAFQLTFGLTFFASYLYRLDSAARRLDKEYEVMTSLVGWESADNGKKPGKRGLSGLLSEGGINQKIQRQIRMTSRLVNLHKQLETALSTERNALDNQVRFVEMLSHEYRTPLAIIRTNLDILEMKDGIAGGTNSPNFSKMKRAMARLVEIMDSSLERQRMDEEQLKGENQLIRLAPFLQNLVNDARELWAERKLELELDTSSRDHVEGDQLLLKTAILNLLDNAIKYSPTGEPVHITLDRTANEAFIQVQNRGRAISPEDQKRIFEKYYRGTGSGNTRGAGLGLYLVRKIMDQHGGSVRLECVNADKTIATLMLPLASITRTD